VFSLKAKTNTFRRKLATIARCDVLENISLFICAYHVETACLVCLDASSCTLYIDHCLIQIIIFVCQLFGNSYLSQILTTRLLYFIFVWNIYHLEKCCPIFANSHLLPDINIVKNIHSTSASQSKWIIINCNWLFNIIITCLCIGAQSIVHFTAQTQVP